MHKGVSEEFYMLDFNVEAMTYQDPVHAEWWHSTIDELNLDKPEKYELISKALTWDTAKGDF